MNYRLFRYAIFTTAGIIAFIPSAQARPNAKEIVEKTRIPHTRFFEANIGEIIAWVREKCGKGPPFFQKPNVVYITDNPSDKRVSESFEDTSVLEILQTVARKFDLNIVVEKDGIYLFPKSEFHFFHTLDGRKFSAVRVIELRPEGIVVKSLKGVAEVLPYKILPEDLKARYAVNDTEVAAHVKAGMDGVYSYRIGPDRMGMVMAGVQIKLKKGKFTLAQSSDTRVGDFVINGKYSLYGHWLTLHKSRPNYRLWLITIIDDQLVLFLPNEYLNWKNGYPFDMVEPLYRLKDQ